MLFSIAVAGAKFIILRVTWREYHKSKNKQKINFFSFSSQNIPYSPKEQSKHSI